MSTTSARAADLREKSNAIAHRTILPVFDSGREHLSTSQIIPNAGERMICLKDGAYAADFDTERSR
jgi:hypothetical protein